MFAHSEGLIAARQEKVPLFVGGDSSGGGTTMSLVLTLAKRRLKNTRCWGSRVEEPFMAIEMT